MKKFIEFIIITIVLSSLSLTVFVGATPTEDYKILTDLLIYDKEDIKEITVIYPLESDPAGVIIDKDKFFDLAKTISLIPVNRIDEIDNSTGLFIIITDTDGNKNEIYLDKRGRIGCPKQATSSAVTTQYDISKEDYIKIYSFLPDEATAHIPLENPMKKYLILTIIILFSIFSSAFSVGYVFKKKRGWLNVTDLF